MGARQLGSFRRRVCHGKQRRRESYASGQNHWLDRGRKKGRSRDSKSGNVSRTAERPDQPAGSERERQIGGNCVRERKTSRIAWASPNGERAGCLSSALCPSSPHSSGAGKSCEYARTVEHTRFRLG